MKKLAQIIILFVGPFFLFPFNSFFVLFRFFSGTLNIQSIYFSKFLFMVESLFSLEIINFFFSFAYIFYMGEEKKKGEKDLSYIIGYYIILLLYFINNLTK